MRNHSVWSKLKPLAGKLCAWRTLIAISADVMMVLNFAAQVATYAVEDAGTDTVRFLAEQGNVFAQSQLGFA